MNPNEGWHPSIDRGGSPGAPNQVLEEENRGVILTATPQTISPDGDGIDEEIVFHVVAPASARCNLRIYDRQGQLIRTLLSDQSLLTNDIHWDGLDMNGSRLPIGMYMILLEMNGGQSVQQAIVVAR
jgi:flagellar hook assembly protein FlgD